MDEEPTTAHGWSPHTSLTTEGEPQQRRLLLRVTDIGLPLVVLIVIGVLAKMLISYGDDEVLGRSTPSPLFGASHADVTSPISQQLPPFKETAFEHAHRDMQAGYQCPHHPEVISEVSGACPICGERLLWSEDGRASDDHIEKAATLMTDARRLKGVSLYGSGWVERLMVREVGAKVQQGELLMEIYVPDFRHGVERQEGVVRLYAPVAGQVRAIHAAEGKFIASGAVVMQIEDSSSLWLQSSVSGAEVARVRAGQRVELVIPTDAKGAAPLGEVDEVVMNREGEGDATVWLRFDDNPVLRAYSEVNVRIHARAVEDPAEKS